MSTIDMHVGESAELYALGTLSEADRSVVDAHVAICDACARRIGEAEETVAALIPADALPSSQLDRRVNAAFISRRVARSWYPFVAAAFVLGLLPSLFVWQRESRLDRAAAMHAQAEHAMVSSHFMHAQFTPLQNDAPTAKVIFARTGAWIYVLANTEKPLTVAAQVHGSERVLGSLQGSGAQRELFVRNPPRTDRIVLLDGSREVARAGLAATR